MSEPKPFTQKALADHFGWHKSYVTKMKKDGMPVTSAEECEKWMQERQMKIGSRTKLPDEAVGEQPTPKQTAPPEDDEPDEPLEVDLPGQTGVSLLGLEQALRDCREVRAKAKKMVDFARKNKLDHLVPQRIANYTTANKEYGRMEEWVRKERERRGELMTVDQHKIRMNKLWIPFITGMRKMPRVLAMKVAPSDDIHAEKVISVEVESVIAEGRKSLESPPDIDYHLKIWLLAIVIEEGGKNALERIDEIRARVAAALAEKAATAASPMDAML